MGTSQPADKLRAVEAAQEALQSGIIPFVEEREASILDRAVGEWRGGTLTPERALVLFGVISELRHAASSAGTAIGRGRDAAEALTL